MASRPCAKQWEVLLNFLESNPDMVSGRVTGPQGKKMLKERWETLAISLNSLGYANKTADKWLKTWTDFKCNIKKKAADIKKDLNKTGGGPSSCKVLSEIEERALQLLGATFLGLNTIEVGLLTNEFNDNSDTRLEEDEEVTYSESKNAIFTLTAHPRDNYCAPTCLPSTSTTVPLSTPRPQGPPPNFNEHTYGKKLKRSGNNSVDEAYNETINLLKEINNTLDRRLTNISENLKTIAKTVKKHIASVAFVKSSFV